MQTQTLTGISVKPPWRGPFLFQTWNQFCMVIAMTAVTNVIIQTVPGLSNGARIGALDRQFFAMLTWLILVLPPSFEWRFNSASARADACQQVLRWFADLANTKEVSLGKYSLEGPRWLLGDTNRVSIETVDSAVTVSGPWIVIRRLRRLADTAA